VRDVWIVFRKEMREWLYVKENWRASLFQMLVFVGVFGIFWPLQIDNKDSVAVTLTSLSLFIGNSVVADSFAGERERNTLETLLATRLSDQAIFLGKFLADAFYTLGLMMVILATSVVSINLFQPREGIFFYSPLGLTIGIGGSLVLTLFGVGLGVFISLRTKTVRAAQQILSIIYLVFFLIIGFVLPIFLNALPPSAANALAGWLQRTDPLVILIGLLLIMLVCDVGMLAFAIRRFQRSRLIVD